MRKSTLILLAAGVLIAASIVFWYLRLNHGNGESPQSQPQQKNAVTNPLSVAPSSEMQKKEAYIGDGLIQAVRSQTTSDPIPPAKAESKSVITDRIEIGGTNVFLLFEDKNLAHDWQKTIASDLERSLSCAKHVEWGLRSRPLELRDITITHELRGWELDGPGFELPEAIEKFFGAGIVVDGKPRLLLIQELIDAYKVALDLRKQYPVMFSEVDEFLALLADRKQLAELIQDQKKASNRIFYYKQSPPESPDAYNELIAYADLRIQPPSILDIRPLSELMQEDEKDNTIFAFCALVLDKEYEKHMMKIPLGAYVDGQWRILVVPMP